MRNCLKLSYAAQTKCSILIKTPIVCVPQTENTLRSEKVKFSESVKHLIIHPQTSMQFSKHSNVFIVNKFPGVSV